MLKRTPSNLSKGEKKVMDLLGVVLIFVSQL